jgi:hypothetical protein
MPPDANLLAAAVVQQGHPWAVGSYKRDREETSKVSNATLGKDGKSFCFVAQANLNKLGPFSNLARQPQAWSVEPSSYKVSQIGTDKGYSLEQPYTDFMAIKLAGNLTSGQVELKLPYTIPAWVSELSYEKHNQLFYDSNEARGKSFGLKAITEGMAEAFGIKGQPITTATFKVKR